MTTAKREARIRGTPVAPLFPDAGEVRVLCVGEAPGPRGADKSGVPFFGDRAGVPLYRALVQAGACVLPPAVHTLPWDGQAFTDHALRPHVTGVALGNAFDRCPTNDGVHFRAPSRTELESADNIARLTAELDRASTRGLVRIIALGRVAVQVMQQVLESRADRWSGVELVAVPHPSAQGLLSAAPDRGRGARLADLAATWERDVAARVRESLEAT